MNVRTQVTLDPEMQRRARAKAAELGISFAEYVRRLVADDLGERKRKADISILFDLVDEGPPTNIARDKDKMIGEAVRQNYLRKTSRLRRRKARRKSSKAIKASTLPARTIKAMKTAKLSHLPID